MRGTQTVHAAMVVRFQGAQIHEGQRSLVAFVRKRHLPRNTLFVIGYSGGVPTPKNPLPKEAIAEMIRQTYRGRRYRIRFLKDHDISPQLWSEDLDRLLAEEFGGVPVTLYGSRKSFIEQYYGVHKTKYVPQFKRVSGTALRAKTRLPQSRSAREALINAQERRPPFMYATVDLAVVDWKKQRVLLIKKKHHGGLYSFCGGHVDKRDRDALDAAKRERSEEIRGIEIGDLTYIASLTVDDPRYRGTNDGVLTTFFCAPYYSGQPDGADDADGGVGWFSFTELETVLVPWHRPLARALLNRYA